MWKEKFILRGSRLLLISVFFIFYSANTAAQGSKTPAVVFTIEGIHTIDARQFQIFDLYVLKKWPVRKVASTVGINTGRVYLAKHRILQLVEKEIKDLKERDHITPYDRPLAFFERSSLLVPY